MRHTVYKHLKCEGDLLTLRTSGVEGTVTLHLSAIRKVKITFPSITVESDDGLYRLDLTNAEPSEFAQAKAVLTAAMKGNRSAAGRTPPIAEKPGPG
jgi:hypothetical protein